MDNLISREALLKEFRSLCGPQTGDGWDNMGVHNLIMRQKAVDAVPVEWLEKKRENLILAAMVHSTVYGDNSIELCHAVNVVLDMWQKEQEAR